MKLKTKCLLNEYSVSKYIHDMKQTIQWIYMINVWSTFFMTGIFPIERFRIKINYKLAYLLFKAAKYVFYVYKRSCLKESFFRSKKKKIFKNLAEVVSQFLKNFSKAHSSIFEEIILFSSCPQRIELNCLCPQRLET